MIAEHRRPLMAFFLVALVCALVVGNAVRTATIQRLVDGGLPLGVLVPIAPDVLFTIDASGDGGRGGDLPYVGRAVVAVSNPAPPSVPTTTAVVTVPIASRTTVVRTVTPSVATPSVAAPSVAARTAAATSTRAAGRHHAAPRRAGTTTSRTPTLAPAGGTPTLSPGRTKHAPTVAAKPDRHGQKAAAHELKRAQHEAEKAAHRQATLEKHAAKAKPEHAAKPHHQKPKHPAKPHPQKPQHQKPKHAANPPQKAQHEKRD